MSKSFSPALIYFFNLSTFKHFVNILILLYGNLFILGKDGSKVTTVVANPCQGPDRPLEVSYTDTMVIGNGSFGVVYQAKLCDTGEMVAIKKVLQDKRFKVSYLTFILNVKY